MKLVGILVTVISLLPLYSCGDEITWMFDLKKGLSEAKSANKVAMIDVFTDWCYWCKELDAKTYKDKRVVSSSRSFVNIKVNPEKDKSVAEFLKNYKIEGYPAILFVDHTGALLLKIGGFIAADAFLKKMNEVPKLQVKIANYKKEYASGNTAHALELLEFLVDRSRFEEAVPIFERIKSDKKFKKAQLGDFYIQVGLHFVMENDYDRAEEYFIDAEDLYPDTFNGFIGMYYHAYSEYLLGKKEKAVGILQKAIRNPKLPAKMKQDFEAVMKAFQGEIK
jgi:thioredoxin-related protein